MWNLILLALIFAGFFYALRHVYINQSEGGCSSCSGGCAGCPSASGCASQQPTAAEKYALQEQFAQQESLLEK